MKLLIVNADDFGLTGGISRGIVAAHQRGIVTSASLLVDAAGSEAAAALADAAPELSVGLHLDLDGVAAEHVPAELDRQMRRFEALIGSPPTHLDTHHDTHRDPGVLRHVSAFARRHDLPLRGHSAAHVCSRFYGQWSGETHLEQISVPGLARVLAEGVADGITELICHPGYADAELRSSYAAERDAEVATLCDPGVRAVLDAQGISLIGFRDVPALVAGAQRW
ncbi:MAG TPA: ChbG/HpnK family deacetylase [Gemmatimonadales bacterium]|nr:ChbG/HpnK family deacetylase [Gemmatimonadales bacterium]